MGSQGNQIVTIRGINSFNSGIEPLFVINGQIIGSSYSQANSMVNVRDIDYVRVLKGPDAATYGVRGGNGVVLIVTKSRPVQTAEGLLITRRSCSTGLYLNCCEP